jgi:hypothetical protein
MRLDETLELLSANDPAQGMPAPSAEKIDRALASILARTQADPSMRGRHARRWVGPSVAAVFLLAVAVVVAAVVVPFGPTSGAQNAWAKKVVARATAFLLHSASNPLYTDVTTITHGGAPVQRTITSQAVTWQYGNKMATTTWALGPRREIEDSVFSGRRVEIFVAATNTIRESLNPPEGSMSYSPVPALLQLSPTLFQRRHLVRDLATATGPAAVSKVMIALMHSRGTRIRRTTLRGSAAIRLSNSTWSGVVYLNPLTYAPREIYRTYVPGTTSHGSQTTIINTYRTVAPSQLPRNLFNLKIRHPTAKVRRIDP